LESQGVNTELLGITGNSSKLVENTDESAESQYYFKPLKNKGNGKNKQKNRNLEKIAKALSRRY